MLGVGASAFDNAATALEAGAARVDLCFRRSDIPRVNPLIWMNFAGMFGHFGELTDLERWRFMRHILEELPVPPTQDTFWRCRRFENFAWHANCAWKSVRDEAGVATVETNAGTFAFDFIIFATGVETDLSARPELAPIVHHIALWRDRFTPPPGEESDLLARHPYLGAAFEFMERQPGTAPFLGRLHNFTFGAMPSLGLTGAAITGMKYGVRRLVNGLARDLFREDSAAYYQDLLTYAVPELETLESAYAWVSRLGSEAISSDKLIDQLDPAMLASVSQANSSREIQTMNLPPLSPGNASVRSAAIARTPAQRSKNTSETAPARQMKLPRKGHGVVEGYKKLPRPARRRRPGTASFPASEIFSPTMDEFARPPCHSGARGRSADIWRALGPHERNCSRVARLRYRSK